MSSVVDVWRAVDADAALLWGSDSALRRPVRAVQRTRAAPPHLPPPMEAALLVADATVVGSLDELLEAVRAAGLSPAAIVLAGAGGLVGDSITAGETAPGEVAVLASQRSLGQLVERATTYLDDEAGWLAALATELRLACAEGALADPRVATPAGLVAARVRRGVAVSADGRLLALHPRPAGRSLAARFAAIHARVLADAAQRSAASRRTRDGLWLIERQVRPGASAWLFDDLPFAAVDEVAGDALSITLRALLRRPVQAEAPLPARRPAATAAGVDPLAATLLAVARHNGRVAPAARWLGVHRNTVLYRLRRARAERGVDPRRPHDALRILAEAEGDRR